MRLTILGATGGIGRLLVAGGLEQGHEVTVLARAPEKVNQRDARLRVVGGDLLDVEQMTAAMRGADVVLSAFGPVTYRKINVRRDFGRAVATAMRRAGVKRVLHVSAALLFRDAGMVINVMRNTLFRYVSKDQWEAEKEMMQPDLEWTMVRPPRLLDKPATGKIRVARGRLPKGGFDISRADVADYMLEEMVAGRYVRQIVGICD
jgi:putative NADH-flavin reductase